MFRRKVDIASSIDPKRLVALVERLCADEDLHPKLKTTLRSYPSSVHWHYSRASMPGTLEITYSSEGSWIMLSVHSNRKGRWTRGMAVRLCRMLKRELG